MNFTENCIFVYFQDNIQKVLLALAVAMETTHRPFRRRRLLQAYALFVGLVSDQLGQGLGDVTPFVVMDIIHTIVRVLGHEAKKMENGGKVGGGSEGSEGRGGVEEMMVLLCFHALSTLSRSAIEACPEVCVCVCVCVCECVCVLCV